LLVLIIFLMSDWFSMSTIPSTKPSTFIQSLPL
jgi:hypothetical protein